MSFTPNINLPISNSKLKKIVEDCSFLYISEKIHLNTKPDIFKKIKESKVISICAYNDEIDEYFFIGYEQTVIIVQQSSIKFLEELFLSMDELLICFYNKTKPIFDKNINIEYKEAKLDFEKVYVEQHIDNKKENKKFIYYLICIMQYLIQKSFIRLAQKDRMKDYDENKIEPKIYNKDDYIELNIVGSGTSSRARLIYSFDEKELLIIKEPLANENDYLIQRELKNYQKIDHPLLPKFYGTTKTNFIVIEYINGQTLNVAKNNLNENEKIIIIYQIMLIIIYFHNEKMILRDLKPDNIMIDHMKNCVFIDFDRAFNAEENVSRDLGSFFVAPDLGNEKFSYECDIYSLGMIIYYLMFDNNPNNENCEYLKPIKKIYELCIKKKPQERPNINDITNYYSIEYHSLIFKFCSDAVNNRLEKVNSNLRIEFQVRKNLTPEENVYYGNLYYLGQEVPYDINIAIYFYTLAANQNDTYAQWVLGCIYYEGKHVPQNIDKAIKYYSLAKNHPKAQYYLGYIYLSKLYNKFDINKALHCFSKSANQNCSEAQYVLGCIYFEGEYVSQDISKAIYFYKLAANENHLKAQTNLGNIYYFHLYCPKNINKAIQYLTLAANQNDQDSQILLAQIYLLDQEVKQDIIKVIHYLTLAANQNNSDAQFKLGVLYSEGKYICKNISKAIYYYTLSSNQNNSKSQFNLGRIYYEGDNCEQDIGKAIRYFTLAAKQNHPKALFILGELLIDGELMPKDIKKGVHFLETAAYYNHIKAQCSLGFIYLSNKYVSQDINKAMLYFTYAADHNDVYAQFSLGIIYRVDCFVPQNLEKAFHYITLAANQNHRMALYYLGQMYEYGEYVSRNINKSIEYYTRAAKLNDNNAQFQLGLIYYIGDEVTIDIDKAIYYFSRLADSNDANAQYYLGKIYLKSKFFDINKAINYFTLAANQNNSNAQYYLGLIYFDNKFIPQNINKSIYYFQLASDNNDSDAQYILGLMYEEGEYVKQDICKSIRYYKLSAKKNHRDALLSLGLIEYNNHNMNMAEYYLYLSAQNGNFKASFLYGFLKHDGAYIKQDIHEAIKYYKDASNYNYEYAKNNLGIIFKNGFNNVIEKNLGLAIEYFQEGIRKKKNKICMYNLAHIYFYDEPYDNSLDLSINFLIQSSLQCLPYAIDLLCLAIIKKYGFDIVQIKNEIKNNHEIPDFLALSLIFNIEIIGLSNELIYDEIYGLYHSIDFLYNFDFDYIFSFNLTANQREKISKYLNIRNITKDFYDGFYG